MKSFWTMERALRAMAGAVILVTACLYFFHSHNWIWMFVFVGANLLQSAFSNWCPAMNILRYCGLRSESGCCSSTPAAKTNHKSCCS